MRFNTDLLHAGVIREANGATLPPVYQSSAFEQDTAADLEKIFENKAPGYCYTRVGNPTVTAFENRITKLEGGMASIACASGMAAIMNAILNIVRSGDEIVSSASLYGGSIDLFRDIEEFGIKTRYVKNNDWEAIEGAINEHTTDPGQHDSNSVPFPGTKTWCRYRGQFFFQIHQRKQQFDQRYSYLQWKISMGSRDVSSDCSLQKIWPDGLYCKTPKQPFP